jgi:hypothetical protein
MKRRVTSTLIAGAITAASGIAFFLGMSRSIEWLMASVYPLMAPGMFLAFFLGLGAHGAVLHTDLAQYVLTFLVWWGLVTLAGALADGAKRELKVLTPRPNSSPRSYRNRRSSRFSRIQVFRDGTGLRLRPGSPRASCESLTARRS